MPSISPIDVLEAPGLSYSAAVVAQLPELRNLEPAWNDLSENSAHPNAFTTYGWYRAWLGTRGEELEQGRVTPHVMVLRNGDKIEGLVPLVRRIASRALCVRKLEFVSGYADYHDFVVGNSTATMIPAIVNHLAETAEDWDVVDLQDLRDVNGSKARIEEALTRAGLNFSASSEAERCPYLQVTGDAKATMLRQSGDMRRKVRKREERALREGYRVRIDEEPHLDRQLLDKLIQVDLKKSEYRSMPPFLGRYPAAFQELIDSLGPRGWLYVATLERNSEVIAYQFGFRCGSSLWDYTKAYDRAFARFGPGTLILKGLFDYAYANGYAEYDFLRGEESYKMVWSDGCNERYRLLIWSDRAKSKLRKFVYHDVKNFVRRHSPIAVAGNSGGRPALSERG